MHRRVEPIDEPIVTHISVLRPTQPDLDLSSTDSDSNNSSSAGAAVQRNIGTDVVEDADGRPVAFVRETTELTAEQVEGEDGQQYFAVRTAVPCVIHDDAQQPTPPSPPPPYRLHDIEAPPPYAPPPSISGENRRGVVKDDDDYGVMCLLFGICCFCLLPFFFCYILLCDDE